MKLSPILQGQWLSHSPICQFQSSLEHSELSQSIRDIRFSTIQPLFYQDNIHPRHNYPACCRPNTVLRNWLSAPYSHSLTKRYFPIPCSCQGGILLRSV